jgi:hypothetical protein
MGASWGGNIVVVDSKTGAVLKEIYEPCMFEGYTGTGAFLNFSWNKSKENLKASWQDVVFSTGGYRTTKMDFMGAPVNRSPRELIFSIPSFSTVPISGEGVWSEAAAKPIPALEASGVSTSTENGEARPSLAAKFSDFETLSWTKDHFFVWNGYGLDGYELPSEKKVWSVDFNPMNDPLPGGSPAAAVFDLGEDIIVTTDRLGSRRLRKNTGALVWFLSYGNADVIPEIVFAGSKMVIAPADRSHEGLQCDQLAAKGLSSSH